MRSADIPVKQADLVDTLSSMRAWLDQAIKHPALRSVEPDHAAERGNTFLANQGK